MTAVFAAWLMKIRLVVREWLAVAGVVVGVALLGLSAGAQGAAQVGSVFQLALIVAVVRRRRRRVRRGPAAQSGPDAGTGCDRRPRLLRCWRFPRGSCPASRRSSSSRTPPTYTLAAAGIVSFLLYATALEGGSVTTATAAVVLAETMPPALVGVLFLGDTTRPGLAAVAGFGFALAVFCAVALARFGEAGERHAGQASDEEAAGSRRAALGT